MDVRDGFIGTIVIACALALNTTLPKKPFLGVLGLCGILLVLFGLFLDNPTKVLIAEVASGGLLLAGTALYLSGKRD